MASITSLIPGFFGIGNRAGNGQLDLGSGIKLAPDGQIASHQFCAFVPQVQKSQRSTALANAVRYFSEEVLDDDRPLYGVYKALEELCHAVGGRAKLAQLVNKPEKYVSDVMETTQLTRHARTQARQLLTDAECRERARILIEAFAKSI